MKKSLLLQRPFGRWPVVAGILIACQLSLSSAEEKISDSALAQIRALQAEKASRSTLHRKLDSQFVFELKRSRGQAIAAGVTELRPNIERQPDGRVLVDINADVTAPLLEAITRSGGTVIHSSPRFRSIRAQVALEQLENLAAHPNVKFIQRALEGIAHTGSINSEADITHRANLARSTFGVGGGGVKIGVLSDGIQWLDSSQHTGDLGEVTTLPGQHGSGYEGTAMLELIKDLAPDAELYFATALNGPANFADNILSLRSNGCDIIVDDFLYFAEPPFQDGIIAQAINSVTAEGALFFSAAGNQGSVRHGTSGTWEGDFVDSGQTLEEYGGRIHAFGSTNYNIVLGGGYGVDLFWADPAGASTNDYDLYVLDPSGSYITHISNNPQAGTQDPYERINSIPQAGSRVVVVKNSGAPRFLRVQTLAGLLKVRTSGATYGHATATNAFGVAAASAMNAHPDAFDTSDPVENFSADGPRRVFFHADGSPITPGNFSSSGGHVRQKPDITAADGAMTTVPLSGFRPFFGTSAAAPHAAAIAALLWSYDRTLSPAQIRTALTSSALDIESPGFDINSGAGIVMADAALATLPPRPVIAAGNATLVYESRPNNAIEPGETVTVAFWLTNRGPAATANLTATLLNTGAVSFASSPQNYGTLSAYGGVGSQTFTFLANGNCGDTASATLLLQDVATNLGSVKFSFQLGAPVILLAENFDYVTPPTLPAGWTATSTGGGLPWRTTNSWSDSEYNSAFVLGPVGTVSDKSLISPSFQVPGPDAQISFWQNKKMEYGSGGVLEISTNGSPFQDILNIGGAFVANGYDGFANFGESHPLEGRSIWLGSDARLLTVADLPASTVGQNVRLRFRFATSTGGGFPSGWHIDSVLVTAGVACGATTANNVVVNSASTPNSVALGGSVAYAIKVGNTGPGNATNVNVTNTLPSGFTIQSMDLPAGVLLDSSNGNTLAFSIPTLSGGENKTINLSGVFSATGLFTNRTTVSRSDGGLSTISNAITTTWVVLPAIFADDAAILEGDAGTTNLIFNVRLATPPFTNASIRFATANQTALAGQDYFSTNGVLTFAPGVTTQSFAVRIIGDLLNETNKTFAVNLSNPTNLTIIKGQAIGTIVNEDPYPYISISDATIAKPNSGTTNIIFNVSLSSPSGRAVSVTYFTSEASAIEGLDFIPTNNILTFAPGQTSLQVRVTVTNHTTVKPAQIFNVGLTSPTYAKLDRSSAVGTIVTALPGRLDHFSWDGMAAPSNGLPFDVTVTARDFFDNVATNFSGSVALSGFSIQQYRTNTFFENASPVTSSAPGATCGYAFTPKTNLWVTHFRWTANDAGKLSLWKNDGTLLVEKAVPSSAPGWAEEPLTTPVLLLAGHTYLLTAYSPFRVLAISTPTFISDLPDAVISQNYYATSDKFPDLVDSRFFRLAADIRYSVGIPTSLPLTPANSGNFSNSAWTGALTV
ncbi:MAG TPA: Calx-beta domain-containing protein, partial [Verrucomicrobiae bacterium]|nr:Calx-beta domain-containing protein [Verrucomicrobiae bacterium]